MRVRYQADADLTDASCAGCDGWQLRSIFEPLPTPAWRDCGIQRCYRLLRNRGEFWSARIGARCPLTSPLSKRRAQSRCDLTSGSDSYRHRHRGACPHLGRQRLRGMDRSPNMDSALKISRGNLDGGLFIVPYDFRPNIFLRSTSPSQGACKRNGSPVILKSKSPCPSSDSAPFSSKIMRD
jgi:hypothetical protein